MIRLCKALYDLGDTADKVAATLRAGKHKGVPHSTCRCPVARYLIAQGFINPVVAGDETYVGDARINTPVAVYDFLERFDEGGYRDLESVEEP